MNSVELKLRTLGGRACRLTASKAIYSSLLTVVILVAVSLAVFMFTTAALGQQTQSDAPAWIKTAFPSKAAASAI